MILKTDQLMPVEVERNRFGAWTHPEVVKYLRENGLDTYEVLSSDDWEELKRYFNIGTVKFYLEAHVSEDLYEEILDKTDLNLWDPIPPHGFFLMSINFTEDGAEAVWAKEAFNPTKSVEESLKEMT